MKALLWFEIKNRLGRPSSWVYFAIFFLSSFFLAIMFAHAFSGLSINSSLSDKLALNSPIALSTLTSSMAYFGILVIAPIFGQSINQDYETKFCNILFATPIRKSTYFFTRYLASFFSVLVIFIAIGLGFWVATWMPFIDRSMVSDNHLWFYVAPYLFMIIPNTLFFGAIFTAVVSLSKKMAPVYITSISIFTGYMISEALTKDLPNKFIAALIEPLGVEGSKQVFQYWSIAQQSSQIIPLTGPFLYNRILWLSIGTLFLVGSYLFFNPFKLPKEKKAGFEKANQKKLTIQPIDVLQTKCYPKSWKVFWLLAISELKQAFSNIYFLMILLCGVLYIFAVSSYIGRIFGTETLPVTYHVLEVIGGSFSLFIAIITAYYAGELIWKDRDRHVHELIDSKPISNLFLYLSKVLSLFFLQLLFPIVILVSCVLVQICKGYYHFEWNVYFQHIFVYNVPLYLLTSISALFIHIVSPNKYIGHAGVVGCWLLILLLAGMQTIHPLYLPGITPTVMYSDMNAFGTSLRPFITFFFYWTSLYVCLAFLSVLFWRRGQIAGWRARLLEYKLRIKPIHKKGILGSLTCFVIIGAFIYYNTNVLNPYLTKTKIENLLVTYEKTYKTFETMEQPNLTAVNVNVDIFPETQSMEARGLFTYQNKTNVPIKTILLTVIDPTVNVFKLEWNRPSTLKKFDEKLGTRIYDLDTPLDPSEKLELSFTVKVKPRGFTNYPFFKKPTSDQGFIVENGSFFRDSHFFPLIGYIQSFEISEDSTRRKYGLGEKERMASMQNTEKLKKTYISDQGTWIDFEATVSTTADQIALAPGYLQKEWIENGRHYFSYKMDKPILPFYAFLSGRYEVVRDHWNDVNIEVYHHPGHATNIDRMIRSVKKSLDYYTTQFSPYQFKQFRIIEFPRYQQFAQAFPNTIPYSEGIGFIAKVNSDKSDDVDYPFYVTAHEMAHQWWAHQVIGGNVQGVTMLSESLAQYSALMVMEKEYGPEQMKKFLKYELTGYLKGRSQEDKKELPLMLNENQMYIHYQKGSLAFYALKDYLGEDTVNQVLRNYIKDVAFQEPPFTRSIDLVDRFKQIVPEDKKYLIEDLFETITFYNNRITHAKYSELPNGRYLTEISLIGKKIRADDLGKEQEIAMQDLIDIGIFDQKGHIQYLQKHLLKNGQNTLSIETDFKPSQAGLDPLYKLINKVPEGNILKITKN